jgi:hypothetical protein
VQCRCLHRFSEHSSISFFPICLCFYRGFISGPFLLLPPLLLPEFVSADSILSSDGFVSRFWPAHYRFSFLTRFRRVKAFSSIRRIWQCPNLMIKRILHLLTKLYISTSNEYYYTYVLRTLLLSCKCALREKSLFKGFKEKGDGSYARPLGHLNLCWADVERQGWRALIVLKLNFCSFFTFRLILWGTVTTLFDPHYLKHLLSNLRKFQYFI